MGLHQTKKIGLDQTNKLLQTKETINRIKNQFIEWEKIFGNFTADMGLTSLYIGNSKS
jgi:hypothetical protein